MFLAQIIFQSGGLRFKNEIACSETGCSDLYPRTIISSNNNHYYGRGYIQLVIKSIFQINNSEKKILINKSIDT